jgi:hypothetical protein
MENGRSPIGSQAMRRAARCSDLGPGGCAPQVINDCAADADRLVLGQRRSEEVAPLTGASRMVGGALNVHAPQCTSQTGRRNGLTGGAYTGIRRVSVRQQARGTLRFRSRRPTSRLAWSRSTPPLDAVRAVGLAHRPLGGAPPQ